MSAENRVTRMPTASADDHGQGRIASDESGSPRKPDRARNHQDPNQVARHRPGHPHDDRLDQHGPADLPAAGTPARSNAISRVRWATMIEKAL